MGGERNLLGVAAVALLVVLAACGGGGGAAGPTPPPPGTTMTIHYLRATPAYGGWGLHLWGAAIAPSVATAWASPRPYDRIENGAAVFSVPVADPAQALHFILHDGDLKSPVQDLSIVPNSFGTSAWVVQDTVASSGGATGVPFATEADARAALALLGNATAGIDTSAVSAAPTDSGLPADWASHANFIEIYVRGYQDSNGDGIGDLQGLVSRLDYLQAQGYTGLWLMPIFRSADHDHGYAVEDYRSIEPDYGTLGDFDQLVAAAHARGMAVILDYVMNHAASTHPLFLDATTTAGNPHHDWFVWSDTHPAGWSAFGADPWHGDGAGWYYGVFSATMPDFNLRNPAVVAYHEDNLRFWLNRGADGFRFDAVNVLFEDNASAWVDAPGNHALLGQLQALVNGYGKRYLVCEGASDPPAYAASTSCGRAFAFQAMAPLYATATTATVDAGLVAFLQHPLADRMPMIIGNHDSFAGDRAWNRLAGNQAQYRLLAASYLLASSTPFVYYGEEVGMADAAGLTGDAALRAPMSWSADPANAGFSTGAPFRALAANSVTQNAAVELADPASLLMT
ncbi:MAG: alpha amylase, putative, amy13F, partial [Pseudomonadota bacterium]